MTDTRPQMAIQVESEQEAIAIQTDAYQKDEYVEAFLPLAEYVSIGIDPMLGPMEDKVRV